jgi:DNA-directed RNA polymerase omega subunit
MDGKPFVTVDSKFRFVLVAAHRAEQLMRGARPKVEAGKRKPTRVAMEEVTHGLVDWGYGPPPQEEPAEVEGGTPLEAAAPEVH